MGFAGPIELSGVARVFYDRSVEGMTNFLCGVNRSDVHALDVNFGRDLARPSRYTTCTVPRAGTAARSARPR